MPSWQRPSGLVPLRQQLSLAEIKQALFSLFLSLPLAFLLFFPLSPNTHPRCLATGTTVRTGCMTPPSGPLEKLASAASRGGIRRLELRRWSCTSSALRNAGVRLISPPAFEPGARTHSTFQELSPKRAHRLSNSAGRASRGGAPSPCPSGSPRPCRPPQLLGFQGSSP